MRNYKKKRTKKNIPNHFSLTFSPMNDGKIKKVVNRLNALPPHRAPYVARAIQFYMEHGEPYETDEVKQMFKTNIDPVQNNSPDNLEEFTESENEVEESMVDINDALAKFNF